MLVIHQNYVIIVLSSIRLLEIVLCWNYFVVGMYVTAALSNNSIFGQSFAGLVLSCELFLLFLLIALHKINNGYSYVDLVDIWTYGFMARWGLICNISSKISEEALTSHTKWNGVFDNNPLCNSQFTPWGYARINFNANCSFHVPLVVLVADGVDIDDEFKSLHAICNGVQLAIFGCPTKCGYNSSIVSTAFNNKVVVCDDDVGDGDESLLLLSSSSTTSSAVVVVVSSHHK